MRHETKSGLSGDSDNLVDSLAKYSTIGGGLENKITFNSVKSVVSGGDSNTVSADYSVILGGKNNEVSGDYSLAFGNSVTIDSNNVVAFYSDSLPGKLGINSPNPHSTLQANGSFATAVRTDTTDSVTDNLDDSDHTIFVDAVGVIIVPPDASDCAGREYYLKNLNDEDADSIKVDPVSSNIENFLSKYIGPRKGWIIQSDGSNWWIISDY